MRKVFQTNRPQEAIEIQQILTDLNIKFEVRRKTSNILGNFFNLILYNVLVVGAERNNGAIYIYVDEEDFECAKCVIKELECSFWIP